MSLAVNPAVFREYDIRGVAGTDLSEEFAEHLGFAFAELISGKVPNKPRTNLTVAVGEDCRITSSTYARALIAGIRKGGVDVIHLGMCPTPATYFSIFHLNLDGAIMVTASHLSAEYNGFKVCVGRDAIFGDQILTLRKIMQESDRGPSPILGVISEFSILPPYIEYLLKDFSPMKSKKVVIDCGNGNGSQAVPQTLKKLGAEVVELYCEVDGTFPNHIPDPSIPSNLVNLIAKVKECGADFGIGIDGDADRIGVVDEKGKILFGDELLIIFSRDILKKNHGATVVSEVKASSRLFDDIKKNHGNPIMWRTGHSLIEAKMKETHALVGGEMSGHMYFADRYLGFDDAVYAAMRVYEIAAQHEGFFSSLLEDLPKSFSTPEIRIACADKDKFSLIEDIEKQLYLEPNMSINKVTLIDGIRIDYEDGWGLVRASNTEAALSLRFEATTQARLDEIRKTFERAIKSAKQVGKQNAKSA